MKAKLIAIFIVGMFLISSSIGITKTINNGIKIDNAENNIEISNSCNVLSTGNKQLEKIDLLNDKIKQQGHSAESKDQSCETGNSYFDLQWTSEHVAQGFKPTMNLFTSLKLYFKRTSGATGYYLVFIRNDTVNSPNWLGGFGHIEDVSTAGEWVTFVCAEHFKLIPGKTYYIVINIIYSLGDSNSFEWRYANGNPYSRGKAYYTIDDGINWISQSNWDFNFQSYGISTNPPNSPSNPTPQSGIENQNVNVDLSWDCSDPDGDSLTYDIYFGTSTPPTLVIGNHPTKNYDPGDLYYDTRYYWQIVAIDSNGAKKNGPVWDFKTLSAPSGPPVVNYIESYYADGSEASNNIGLLLQGLNITNTYTAFVAGNNVDQVEFVFEFLDPLSWVVTDTNGNDGWTATINTKDILNPFATYKARAHNDKGWGEYKEYDPKIVPIVGWLVNYIEYLSDHDELGYVTFEVGEKEYPAKAKNNFWTLEASIDLSTESPGGGDSPVDTEVDVPVDDIGGDYGYSGGIGSSIIISSDGIIDISGELSAEVEGKGFSGGIGASLHGTISIENYEIKWGEMLITIGGHATIPVFLVPLSICGIGIEAGIDISPSIDITFQLEPTDNPNDGLIPGLGIKLKDDAGISGNVAFEVKAYAGLGIVIADFYGEAGGRGTLYFKTPASPPMGYFDNFVLDAWIGGRIRFLFWTAEGWYTYSWSYRGNSFVTKDYEEYEWAPLDRDYITQNYNNFVWDDGEDFGRAVENAFPHAKPSIVAFPDSAGTKLMIVWAHDNENKVKVKGMELQYTIWEKDVGMNTPSPIPATNDNQLQMDSQIAFDKNGNVVCVFVQTDSSIDANSDYVDAAEASEIAYCVWDKNSENWGGINTITNNNQMDIQPVLGTNDNGELILLWTSDADCDDPDTTLEDRSIYVSYWSGSSWSTPEILVSNQPIVSTPRVALKDGTTYGNLQGISVFSMDGDLNPLTTDDQNIYYINIDQNSISATINQFTSDSYQDISPSVVYGEDGNTYIVWQKNKFHYSQNEKLYDGALYYQAVGAKSSPSLVTEGRISDPIALGVAGTKSRDTIFRIGWAQEGTTSTLHYANITFSKGVEKGAIYGCESKLTETDWCIAPAGISAATIERPQVKDDNKKCNLSFVYTHGYDYTSPITSCSLIGVLSGYGLNGPQFGGDVEVEFDAFDEGGSSVEKTEYRIDYGAWVRYNGKEIVVSSVGNHKVQFRSIDKAGNTEIIKDKIFEIIVSHAPAKPAIPSGPTAGSPGTEYTYYTSTDDPDGDKVYYMWDWGDEISSWMGPYNSGEVVSAKHKWQSGGQYNIKVRARDVHGIQGTWSDPLKVTMPRNKVNIKPILQRLLEIILQKFPLLERLLFAN